MVSKAYKKFEYEEANGILVYSNKLKCKTCLQTKTEVEFDVFKSKKICKECSAIKVRNKIVENYSKYLYNLAKQRAIKNNLVFSIKIEDVVIPIFCPVLGIELVVAANSGKNTKDNCPTIDRINNLRGYEPDNIAIISWRANRLKSDGSIEEFKRIIEYIEGRLIY